MTIEIPFTPEAWIRLGPNRAEYIVFKEKPWLTFLSTRL